MCVRNLDLLPNCLEGALPIKAMIVEQRDSSEASCDAAADGCTGVTILGMLLILTLDVGFRHVDEFQPYESISVSVRPARRGDRCSRDCRTGLFGSDVNRLR